MNSYCMATEQHIHSRSTCKEHARAEASSVHFIHLSNDACVTTAGGTAASCTPVTYIWDPVPHMWALSKARYRPHGDHRGRSPPFANSGASQSFGEK